MTRPYAECDTECYPDWWLIKFWLPDGRFYSIERTADKPLAFDAVQWFIDNFTLVTFNGENYDEPMISLAMAGASNAQLKQANDQIIVGGLKRWHFYDAYRVSRLRNFDHIDVMEVAPGVRVGLKTYMGRMHSTQLQDLPYNPSELTTPHMRSELDVYCGNDLIGTRELRETVAKRLALRVKIGQRYGVDVRSKSDAQMAEAVMKAMLCKDQPQGYQVPKRIVPHGHAFKYTPPAYVRFNTHTLREVLRIICDAEFVVKDVDQLRKWEGEEILEGDGKKMKTGVQMPLELKDLVIKIGSTNYKLGIGGLHSQEQKLNVYTVPDVQTVRMDDVTSYYPSLIIKLMIDLGLTGEQGKIIYRAFRAERVEAKKLLKQLTADKALQDAIDDADTTTEGLKIFLNGTFGKLFSKYSVFFNPEGGISTTLGGQLSLLMLIESLELHGVKVVSANTDGLVTVCPAGREWMRDECIRHWSVITGLQMESEVIRSLHARDVNSYVAIMVDGTHKAKGAFADSGVLNNVHPDKDVVTDAVIAYLKTGKQPAETIHACADVRKFLVIRSVRGGGCYKDWMFDESKGAFDWHPSYLGKTVRWYYAANETRHIEYATNGNKVAGSTGARPLMRLPETMPTDIDYARYVTEAIEALETLGLARA